MATSNSGYKMEKNINIGSFSIPLDSIDLSVSRFQSMLSDTNATLPIWRADRHDDDYYEFKVYGGPIPGSEIEHSICQENNHKTTCHICSTDVPSAYISQHCNSDQHKTCLNITQHAMNRLQKHAANTMCTPHTEPENYFCDICSLVIKIDDKMLHLATEMHQINAKYNDVIKDLAKAFTERDSYLKRLEKEFNSTEKEESTHMKLPGKEGIKEDNSKIINTKIKSQNYLEAMNLPRLEVKERSSHLQNSNEFAENSQEAYRDSNKTSENTQAAQRVVDSSDSEEQELVSESEMIVLKEIQDYLDDIQIINCSLIAYNGGVTLNFTDGTQVRVSLDQFHGFHRSCGSYIQCRVCRVLVQNETEHISSDEHLRRIQARLIEHCIRQLDSIWYHCLVCNDFLENASWHTRTPNHVSQLKQATITQASSSSSAGRFPLMGTGIQRVAQAPYIDKVATCVYPKDSQSSRVCKHCNINLPPGKPGRPFRKSHNKTSAHKYNKWLATKDIKIHFMMRATDSRFEVVCKVCDSKVNNEIEAIDEHIRTVDHKTQSDLMLEFNLVTITSNYELYCNACSTSLLFFEVIDHICKKVHKRRVAEKRNVMATQVFEANQNESQISVGAINLNEENETEIRESVNKTALVNHAIATKEVEQHDLENPSVNENITEENAGINTTDSDIIETQKIETASEKYQNWLILNHFTQTAKKIYRCHVCQRLVTKATLFNHSNLITHQINLSKTWPVTNGETRCQICDKNVLKYQSLEAHVVSKKHLNKVANFLNKGPKTNEDLIKKTEAVETDKLTENNSSHLFKATEAAQYNIENNTKPAPFVTPSTSEQIEGTNNEKQTTASALKCFIAKNEEKQVYCRLCSTKVPDTKGNITDHLNGKRHANNLKLISDNSMIITNGMYLCNVCSDNMPIINGLQHVSSKKHQDAMLTAMKRNEASLKQQNSMPTAEKPNETTQKQNSMPTAEKPNETTQKQNSMPTAEKPNETTQKQQNSTPTAENLNETTQQQQRSMAKKDIEHFCKICSVYAGKGESRKAHDRGIIHKMNVEVFKSEPGGPSSRLKKLAYRYPFEPVLESDKTHCTICDVDIQITKIEKHIQLKSHADRLLDENLNKHTSRLSIGYLRSCQIDDHGNGNFYCRLCKISVQGRWRAEIHIIGQGHLSLLDNQLKSTNTSPSLKSDTDDVTLDQKNQAMTSNILENESIIIDPIEKNANSNARNLATTSSILMKEMTSTDHFENNANINAKNLTATSHILEKYSVIIDPFGNNANVNAKNLTTNSKIMKKESVIIDPLESNTNLNYANQDTAEILGNDNIVNPFGSTTNIAENACNFTSDIKIVPFKRGNQSANSSGLEYWSDLDDEDGVEFKDCLSEVSHTSSIPVTLSSETRDNEQNIESVANETIVPKLVAKLPNTTEPPVKENIPECFKKTEKPKELFCLFCKVIVPFIDDNIENHLEGEKHQTLARSYNYFHETENPKEMFCWICEAVVPNMQKTVLEHSKGMKHKLRLEIFKTTHKLAQINETVIVCETCSTHFDIFDLSEHVRSQKHMDNFQSQPGTSEITKINPKIRKRNLKRNSEMVMLN